MADKKRRKAKQQRVQAAADEQLTSTRADGAPEPEEASASKAVSEPKNSAKDKAKNKGKDKGKDVVKSQARAKDPKKSNKKPNIFRRFIEYIKQVRLEIKRTTWPTKHEVLNLTIIVLIALLFFGVLIFILDFIMVQLLQLYAGLAPDGAVADAAALADAASGVDGSGAADGADAAAGADTADGTDATDGGE